MQGLRVSVIEREIIDGDDGTPQQVLRISLESQGQNEAVAVCHAASPLESGNHTVNFEGFVASNFCTERDHICTS